MEPGNTAAEDLNFERDQKSKGAETHALKHSFEIDKKQGEHTQPSYCLKHRMFLTF